MSPVSRRRRRPRVTEHELDRLSKMSTAAIRKRIAEAWRRMRRTHPELARDLWKRAKKEPANA